MKPSCQIVAQDVRRYNEAKLLDCGTGCSAV